MHALKKTIRLFLWLTFITGIIYPLIVTAIAQLLMPTLANGNFISINEKIIGADRIGQKFEDPKYFWPRPSASDYSAMPSQASNLGPTSHKLKEMVAQRKAHILAAQPPDAKMQVPSELLFASASGLDPDLSFAGAKYQINRIISARKWPKEASQTIENIIKANMKAHSRPLFGPPYVNVLRLNLALDELNFGAKGVSP